MIGVILANTGSPEAPDPDSIERYLHDYLMDDRIRQMPKLLWKYLLYRHILPRRKFSSAKRYEFIWTEGGSPLVVNQQALADKVQALFDAGGRAGEVVVRSAMSYGAPSLVDVLEDLRGLGADKIVLLPLYPQSAFSPTLAVVDAFGRAQDAIGWHPESIVIDNYHDDPGYVAAVVKSIRGVGFDPGAGDRLLLSFHAIPLKDEAAGDAYRAQIAESVALIADGLGIEAASIAVAFQSVFGHSKSAWTSPLASEMLESWRNGGFRVVYACPGFAVDCLETMYDIPHEMVPALEGEDAVPLVAHVGPDIQAACNTSGRFVWVPTLNASDEHAALLRDVVERRLQGAGCVRNETGAARG